MSLACLSIVTITLNLPKYLNVYPGLKPFVQFIRDTVNGK